MLRDEVEEEPIIRFGAKSLLIRNEVYDNTAAKFWSSLIDEVLLDFPSCDSFSLAASGAGPLSADLLYPVDALQRDLDMAEEMSLEEAIRRAVEELTMFGPTAPVTISLFSGVTAIKTQQLPRECVDSNAFSFLLVWLMEWSAIPTSGWNNEFLSGKISATDSERKCVYEMNVALHNKHLSEGLFIRSVTMRFRRHGQKRSGGS